MLITGIVLQAIGGIGELVSIILAPIRAGTYNERLATARQLRGWQPVQRWGAWQRPHSVRSANSGTSSATGLLLNFPLASW